MTCRNCTLMNWNGCGPKISIQNANKDAERQELSTTASGKGSLVVDYKIKHVFDIQLHKSSLRSKTSHFKRVHIW